ncbi:MAG: LON peptidase substrate-binding domain-containing protein [Opitutaceae bacterium]|nr:LON peptidase substrate-binding domain-containing protein [Opitutaceae bacterium]
MQTITIPPEMPVMTLPGAVFFPKTVIPLRIFEPRYRQMLEEALAGDRIFAVAALNEKKPDILAPAEPPHRVATAGIIRACQKSDDGTSMLLLEGLSRIEITGIVREAPYRVIAVQPLADLPQDDPNALTTLRGRLVRAFTLRAKMGGDLPAELRRAVADIADPAALCDLLVFSIARDKAFKQRMLETLDPAERLRATILYFQRESEMLAIQRRTQGRLADDEVGNN